MQCDLSNLIVSKLHPGFMYHESNETHKELYRVSKGECFKFNIWFQNIIIFETDITERDIESTSSYLEKIYEEVNVDDNKIMCWSTSTPIDRQILRTASIYIGDISYYYYELNINKYGYEQYVEGDRNVVEETNSMSFFYRYPDELGVKREIEKQKRTVFKLMAENDIEDIDEVVDLGALVDDEGIRIDEMEKFSFFDSAGLKSYIKGG